MGTASVHGSDARLHDRILTTGRRASGAHYHPTILETRAMTRLQRYYRRRAIVEYTFITLATLAAAAFDATLFYAWWLS